MKIRIAIARDLSDLARWNAAGWANADDKTLLNSAAEWLEALDVAWYWVDAELPDVPPVPVIQGSATKATEE